MIFLPVFLLILFGIIWIVQTSVINERLQFAVRYSGLISNSASPFSAWSLYSLYENTEFPGAAQATRTCYTPAPGVLSNASPFPGPTSAPFWQPSAVDSTSCGAQIVSMPALSQGPVIFNDMVSSMTANATIPSYLKIGSPGILQAQQKFFGPPDMKEMLGCFPTLSHNIAQSLIAGDPGTSSAPAQLPSVPTSTSLTTSC